MTPTVFELSLQAVHDAMAIEILVLPLVGVGQQAVVAGLCAILAGVLVAAKVLAGIGVEVQQLQRFPRDDTELAVFSGDPSQHSGTAFGGFEEQQP